MIITIPLFIAICIVAWVIRPRKNIPKSQRYTILAVTLPSLILAITAVVFQILQNATGRVEVSGISNILFIIGLFVIAIAVMAFLTVEIGRKKEIKKGIGFGICIAIAIAIIEFGLLEWLGGV